MTISGGYGGLNQTLLESYLAQQNYISSNALEEFYDSEIKDTFKLITHSNPVTIFDYDFDNREYTKIISKII